MPSKYNRKKYKNRTVVSQRNQWRKRQEEAMLARREEAARRVAEIATRVDKDGNEIPLDAPVEVDEIVITGALPDDTSDEAD